MAQAMVAIENQLRVLVDDFTRQLVSAVETATVRRIQTAILGGLNGGIAVPRRRGRPPKNTALAGAVVFPSSGRRRPKQFCPVPGCKNPAAPIFGMVCSKHRDVPRATINEYREQRRKAKAKRV